MLYNAGLIWWSFVQIIRMHLLKSMEWSSDLCQDLSRYIKCQLYKIPNSCILWWIDDVRLLLYDVCFWPLLLQAAVSALQYQPVVNAVIDGDDIIYRDYIDISIAVGTPKVHKYSFDLYSIIDFCLFYVGFWWGNNLLNHELNSILYVAERWEKN